MPVRGVVVVGGSCGDDHQSLTHGYQSEDVMTGNQIDKGAAIGF